MPRKYLAKRMLSLSSQMAGINIRDTRRGGRSGRSLVLMMFVIGLVTAGQNTANADTKPINAKPANRADILALYAGKSWRWNDVRGGAYHAKNGKLTAILEIDEIVGIGRWTVDAKGTLCHNANWYWRTHKPKQRKVKDCWRHVVDQDGNLWQHDQRHGWYKFSKAQISSGNKYTRRVSVAKKKIGL